MTLTLRIRPRLGQLRCCRHHVRAVASEAVPLAASAFPLTPALALDLVRLCVQTATLTPKAHPCAHPFMRAPRVCSPAPHYKRRMLPRQRVTAHPSLSTPPSPRARNLALAGHAHAVLVALAHALALLAGRRGCGLIGQLVPRTTTHGALAASTRVLAADAAHRALTSPQNPLAARQSRLHSSRRASISSGCGCTALCIPKVNTLGLLALLRLCESVSTFAVVLCSLVACESVLQPPFRPAPFVFYSCNR
jgi:hypothetical protein